METNTVTDADMLDRIWETVDDTNEKVKIIYTVSVVMGILIVLTLCNFLLNLVT